MTDRFLPLDFVLQYRLWFLLLAIITLVTANGFIAYAVLKYRLLDVELSVRRAVRFALICAALFLGVMPLLYLLYKNVVSDPANSFSMFVAGFLALGTVVFLGPFIYAYLVRRRSYFNDYTVAGLAHELKNPLGIIEHAVVYLTDQDQMYPFGTKQAEYMRMIERNAFLMRKYVENLLHVFKFKGDKALHTELVDIRAVCHQVVESFQSTASIKGISIEETSPSKEVLVLCDPEKIDQALSNLVSNAIKFTKQGKVKVKVDDKRSRAVVSVEDSGPGIPKDELPYVFDRFYQGRFGRKFPKGTGLGLAIAKTWITAHNGEIYAESDGEGRGSRLSFALPK